MKKEMGVPFGGHIVLLKLGVLLTILAGACATYDTFVAPVVTFPDANYVGSEGCAVCHEDVFEYYRKTVHYKVREFETAGRERGCEGCHGPGSAHIAEKGKPELIISFNSLTAAQGSSICLKCHSGGPLSSWYSNLHALSDVGCNTGH